MKLWLAERSDKAVYDEPNRVIVYAWTAKAALESIEENVERGFQWELQDITEGIEGHDGEIILVDCVGI